MEKKVYDKTRISTCCQAPVFVGGDDKEGTHYYVCEKCNKPCDSEGLNTSENGIGLAKPRKDCDCAYCREYFGSVGDDPSEEQPAKYNTKEILINGTKPLDIKTEEEKKELKCMKCGSKENLNSNRDNSFVECDKCMWEKDEPEEILVEKEFIWYRIKLGETLKKIAEKNGIDDIEREDGFTKVGWKVLWEFNKDLIPNPNRLIYVDEDQYEDGWCINHKQGILRIPISKLKE